MDLFLENCGVRSLEAIVEWEGAGPPAVHRFSDRPYLLIGRDARNDLRLDDAKVSKRHAYLQAVGGRIFCVDLGSRTGVHWPSGPRPLGWVEWEEPLRVGGAIVRISRPRRDESRDALPSEEDLAVSRPATKVVVEVTEGAARPVLWGMNRLLALVGGAAACKVRLRDPNVSRFHCSLVRGPLGVWAIDLLSRSGTQVNGRQVPWAKLDHGDLLQVGPYVLRIKHESWNDGRSMEVTRAAPRGRALLAAPPSFSPPAVLDRSQLLPFINEFHVMQQQMFDQFHQTLLIMAEMFSTLHKEQAGLVREELEHLRRLTRELNALQTEQARQAAPGLSLAPRAAGQAVAAPAEERRPQTTEGAATSEMDKPRANESTTEGPAKQAPEQPKEAAETRPPAVAASPDVHDWLTRRIDTLQTERQGRWQKLLQIVMGR